MDLATVHGKHDAGTPVEEALRDTVAHQSDGFARESAEVELVFVGVDGEILEEDGRALDGLLAERALPGSQLEGVRDLVAEVADEEGVSAAFFGEDAGLLGGVVEEAGFVSCESF